MNRPRSGANRQPSRSKGGFSRSMQLATIIGVLVVCALIATSLGAIWMDSQAPAPLATAEATADPGRDYENLLRANVQSDPNDVVSATSLANLLATRGEYAEAIPLYAQAVETEPANTQYRLDFALALAQSGSLADAELQYRKVVEADPNNAEAHFFLGELYTHWNPVRLDDAVASYERAIAAEPASVSADLAEQALARLKGQRNAATPVATEGS